MFPFVFGNNSANAAMQIEDRDNPFSDQVFQWTDRNDKRKSTEVSYLVFSKTKQGTTGNVISCDKLKTAKKIARSPKLREKIYKDVDAVNDEYNDDEFITLKYTYSTEQILTVWDAEGSPDNESDIWIKQNIPIQNWAYYSWQSTNEFGITSNDKLEHLYINIRH